MASFSVPCPKSSAVFKDSPPNPNQCSQQNNNSISFPLFSKSKLALLSGASQDRPGFVRFQGSSRNQSNVKVHAQLNEVAVEKLSNSAPVPGTKSEVMSSGKKDEPSKKPAHQNIVPDVASISAFMNQVADIVELVDSRDIMELQLKQLGCELIIRKKEAFQQPPIAAPAVMMQPSLPYTMFPSQLPPTPVGAPASAVPVSSPPVSAPAPPGPEKPSKSSHPPLKCPMAGTFYRSPAPGAPPFVKVGDKVQKGQVVCIIEAMKLMNEIEADQSGTVVEILVDDGKPVSLDLPLFVIEP